MVKSFYIIDGHAHIYAAYYAPMRQQLTSPKGEPTKAAYIFTTALLSFIQKQTPDMLVVAMDSKTPTFRKKIYSEYKANRPPMPDDLPAQIEMIEQILDAMNIPVLRVNGYEADDVIGTLVKKADPDKYKCFICSKDKDMLQLIDKNTSTFDVKTETEIDPEQFKRLNKISPKQFVDCLALQGDTADNVPGVPDVGKKTALSWIQKFSSIENLYKNIDQIKGKRADNLRKFKDQLKLSKKLVTIDCSVPMKFDYEDFSLTDFDKTRLARIFTELGFNRLLNQLNLSEENAKAAVQKPLPEGDLTEPDSVKTVPHDYKLIDTPEKFDNFFSQLKKQKIFAIDTETTSIKAMKADLVAISFAWEPSRAFYLPVKAPLGNSHLDLNTLREKLAPILADENVKKIGQNIKYDYLVLKNAELPISGIHFDTMVAAYCLDPQRKSLSMDNMARDFLNYECIPIKSLIGKGKNQLTFDMVDTDIAARYAAEDADITLRLYHYLKQRLESNPSLEKLFDEIEMPLVTVLADMEYNGISLDVKLLNKMSADLHKQLELLTAQIYHHAGATFNIDSPKQLAEVLFDQLNLKSARVGKARRSTDADVLEQLYSQHPIIEPIIQYRTLSKLINTYIDKLGSLINHKTNRVHASFNQTITATGRLSSSNPNLQNIPIRTEVGRKIRSAFIPQNKSDCILSADYSQVELRLLAHFSNDKALKDAFNEDRDIHTFVASQIYNVPIEDVTPDMRSSCKAVNFGIIYGQGAFGLSKSVGISVAEAKKFIDDYFKRYSSIKNFTNQIIQNAEKTGYVETIMHRRRKIQNLKSRNANKRAQAHRFAVNTVIQGSAADLIKIAMLNIHKKIKSENLPVKLILQIHDELVFELPENQVQKHKKWINEKMTSALKLNVPLKVDINTGPTWLNEK